MDNHRKSMLKTEYSQLKDTALHGQFSWYRQQRLQYWAKKYGQIDIPPCLEQQTLEDILSLDFDRLRGDFKLRYVDIISVLRILNRVVNRSLQLRSEITPKSTFNRRALPNKCTETGEPATKLTLPVDFGTKYPGSANSQHLYESLRAAILSTARKPILSRSFYDFTTPRDKQLPSAFLNSAIEEILAKSFNELVRIRGVGPKRVWNTCKVLERIRGHLESESSHKLSACLTNGSPGQHETARLTHPESEDSVLDHSRLTKHNWDEWRHTVSSLDIGDEPLGKFVITLNDLPKTLWDCPLSEFSSLSYEQFKTGWRGFGRQKRKIVADIFFRLNGLLKPTVCCEEFIANARPKWALSIERWMRKLVSTKTSPTLHDIRRHLVNPLVRQIQTDGNEKLAEIARMRIGIDNADMKVHDQSPVETSTLQEIGALQHVTKEMVRQGLLTIALIFQVRWQEGAYFLDDFCESLESDSRYSHQQNIVANAFSLLFPVKKERRDRGQQTRSSTERETIRPGGRGNPDEPWTDRPKAVDSQESPPDQQKTPTSRDSAFINEAILSLLNGEE